MSVFDWFKQKEVVTNPTRQAVRRPAPRDYRDNLTINLELTKGLYHNSYPGLKLAGGLSYTPIAVPVFFMGLPIPKSAKKNKRIDKTLEKIVQQFSVQMDQNHIQTHRDGTTWIFPHYSSKLNKLIWEFIPDDTISDIIRDINTNKIIKIATDEQIIINAEENRDVTVRRQRSFTREKIEVKWLEISGYFLESLKDSVARNVINILPINFSNNADGDEVRGHSDYERILADLKDYHDISLARSEMLAKFKVKMIQETSDVDAWLANNAIASIAEYDVANTDLIINLSDKEKTSYIFPTVAIEAYDKALKQIYYKLVEASGCPEIVWGLKTVGNVASVEENMATLMKYVQNKQKQKNESYKKLFTASLQLLNIVNFNTFDDTEIEIVWNELDSVSDEVRALIFKNYAQGLSLLANNADITIPQMYNIWKKTYPGFTDMTFEEFNKGLNDMGKLKQWNNASFTDALDFSNMDNEVNKDNEDSGV